MSQIIKSVYLTIAVIQIDIIEVLVVAVLKPFYGPLNIDKM